VGTEARRHKKKHRRRRSRPLNVTPPLGQSHFIFPVVGPSGYGDSYGDKRSDVPGGWHHGDDIFAPLGAPLVAVASGTINRVGWERVGGWRLWVRDSAGDEFHYAHLSGYTRAVFHSKIVRAGEVIGFLGNTGDAFTGVPHLHFEIHPRQLLSLDYDGAVDPTKYLDSWSHLRSVDAPYPVHPRLPKAFLLRSEAREVFHELLAARHVLEPPAATPRDPVPEVAGAPVLERLPTRTAASTGDGAGGTSPSLPVFVLAGVMSLALWATAMLARLRRRRAREIAPHAPPELDES
jgi:Peptidase family M23